MTASRTSRDEAFCAYTILEQEAFIVKYEQQGMGLGLELARAIAEKSGFSIQLCRVDDSEVEAEFRLPA